MSIIASCTEVSKWFPMVRRNGQNDVDSSLFIRYMLLCSPEGENIHMVRLQVFFIFIQLFPFLIYNRKQQYTYPLLSVT